MLSRRLFSFARTGLRYFSRQPQPVNENPPNILVTGACGQIGSELVIELRERFGMNSVVATDVRLPEQGSKLNKGPFLFLDVLDYDTMAGIILKHGIDWIVHLSAILSALGEKNPQLATKLNTRGIENVLELARVNHLRVFSPSTIAVFGPTTPREMTPDLTIMRPTTIYGVTKVYLELLGSYYHTRYGVDFRSVRYPGVISSQTMPGGGTTDYAVEIYHEALKKGKYRCFLSKDTEMPMLYMPDCIAACVNLMTAPPEKLSQRVYNITGFSFTPEILAKSIKKEIPNFEIEYAPDYRQAIADSWPKTIDDSIARKDWGWNPVISDCDSMTKEMMTALRPRYSGTSDPS